MNHKYPEYIMRTLRERNYLDEDDSSQDEMLQSLSPEEVFEHVLEWEGIIGYRRLILNWICDIFKVRLSYECDEQEPEEFKEGISYILNHSFIDEPMCNHLAELMYHLDSI